MITNVLQVEKTKSAKGNKEKRTGKHGNKKRTIFLSDRGSSPTVHPFLQQRFLNMASATINLSLVERTLITSSTKIFGDKSMWKKTQRKIR